jgi:hypothetical protein
LPLLLHQVHAAVAVINARGRFAAGHALRWPKVLPGEVMSAGEGQRVLEVMRRLAQFYRRLTGSELVGVNPMSDPAVALGRYRVSVWGSGHMGRMYLVTVKKLAR